MIFQYTHHLNTSWALSFTQIDLFITSQFPDSYLKSTIIRALAALNKTSLKSTGSCFRLPILYLGH